MSSERFDLSGFHGTLIHAEDDAYDDARKVFNGMIDRKPAVIARCSSAEDVVAAVHFARELRLPLSVYAGGHSVTGSAVVDAGICIDLRGMRAVEVDPDQQTACVEGGATWGEFDAATQEHTLAVTGGRVSTTGVAGLTLGSGSGWLERKYGFVCDNLLEAEVVTADGRIVTASESENAELFWGLRGGGGNFGIVTKFTLRVHPLGPVVLGGMLMHPAEGARDLLEFFDGFIVNAPDEIGAALAFVSAPPLDFVPEPVRGQPVVGAVCCYAGPVEEGEAAFAPLREFGAGMDMMEPMPYTAVQQLLDAANPHGLQNYWTADFYDDLPEKAFDVLAEYGTNPVSPMTQIIIAPGGGAIARVEEEATAIGQRDARWNIHYLSMWSDPADTEKNIMYTREFSGAMKPWSTGRSYLNFIGDEGLGRVEAAFGPEKFARLQALKDEWDPQNLFRINQNIPPTGKATRPEA